MDNEFPISVVMSVYNEPVDWIRQSIDSILNQTFSNFEFIIVNDNPDSIEHKDLLHDYANRDSRIKLIENAENKGLTKSLNIGIAEASGQYIARMDADDISFPNRLQVQFDYMEAHPEVDVCGCCAKEFGAVHRYSGKRLIVPETNEQIKIRAFVYSPMIHPSVMFRMERLPNILYNENFNKAQDYVLWGDLIEKGFVLYNIQKDLIKYRVTAKSGKSNYKSQQFVAANSVRANLLNRVSSEIDDKTIELHNRICNEQTCDLSDAEKWLLKLKNILTSRANPEYNAAISALISRLWININLTNGNSLSNYRKSQLTKSVSLIDYIRFIKRKACKMPIVRKFIRGGLSLVLYCVLLLSSVFAVELF